MRDDLQPLKRKGFALIAAIALIGFVLMIIIAMATLVQVELQTAGVNRHQAQARSNALLGALVALGELQELAGPDTRVTATASVMNSSPDELDGMAGMTEEKTHWTGVWDVVHDESSDTYSPQLLSFLVSGMPESSGEVLDAVKAYDEGDPDDYASLLGTGSVSSGGEVHAKKVPVGDTGSFAYWVSDEGVKTRINLVPDDIQYANSLPASRIKVAAPEASPGSVVDGLEEYPDKDDSVELLIDNSALPLAASGLDRDNVASRYHDFTLYSLGLQTNTAQGGLKKDLSLAFEMTDQAFNDDEYFAGVLESSSTEYPFLDHKFSYVYNKPFDPADPASKTIRGPTWHVLRNYYRQYYDVATVSGAPVYDAHVDMPLPEHNDWYDSGWTIPVLYSLYRKRHGDPITTDEPVIESNWLGQPLNIRPTEGAVTPIVTRVQNIFSMRARPLTQTEKETWPPGGAASGHTHQLQIVWDPIVTICNPYNVNLKFEGLILEIGLLPINVHITTAYPTYLFDSLGVTHPGGSDLPTVSKEGGLELYAHSAPFHQILGHAWDDTNDWISSTETIIFKIGEKSGPITMKPGEVLVYSLGGNSPITYHGDGAKTVEAVPGFDGTSGFAFDTGITGSPSEATKRNLELSIESYSKAEEHSSLTYFLVEDWSKIPEDSGGTGSSKDTPGSVYMGSAWPREPQEDDFGRVPEDAGDVIKLSFQDLGTEKEVIAQLDYYMKASDVTRESVSLGIYNNPRARSFTTLGKDPVYKTSDPLWGYRLHEVTSIIDLANASTDNHGYWGESNASGTSYVSLFEVPTAPLSSLGQLMHANVSFRGHNSMYTVGTSYASPYIPKDEYFVEIPHYNKFGFKTDAVVPDIGYLMNEALWDGYFFSTLTPSSDLLYGEDGGVDSTFTGYVQEFVEGRRKLPNQRMALLDAISSDELAAQMVAGDQVSPNAYKSMAGYVGVQGAFNVNSTSVEAWKSMLSSLRDEAMVYFDAEGTAYLAEENDIQTPFAKFTLPNGTRSDAWRGYSTLDDGQITELAENIVALIHERGPFPTLASFVNRELATGESGLAGVIEAAIQSSSKINQEFYSDGLGADPDILLEKENINRYGTSASLPQEVGVAGFLTQADILMAIGGMISNRSDTFVIRSYGEVSDPLTQHTQAEAWLEMVVQRVGVPVEPSSTDPLAPEYFTPLEDENGNSLGRSFRIVSIRWLSKEEV